MVTPTQDLMPERVKVLTKDTPANSNPNPNSNLIITLILILTLNITPNAGARKRTTKDRKEAGAGWMVMDGD